MPDGYPGIVYLLTNAAMPGLTKIGTTTQEDIRGRMAQLYTTGVPVQFDCFLAVQVADCVAVETAIHRAFDNVRVNPKREFFRIDPEAAEPILRLLGTQVVTGQVEQGLSEELDAEDKGAREKLNRSRRPHMNFEVMKIPVGAILTNRDDDRIQVKVVDDRHVEYNGVPCSLAKAHREIFKLDYNARPAPYWAYNGKSLKEIYDEAYAPDIDG